MKHIYTYAIVGMIVFPILEMAGAWKPDTGSPFRDRILSEILDYSYESITNESANVKYAKDELSAVIANLIRVRDDAVIVMRVHFAAPGTADAIKGELSFEGFRIEVAENGCVAVVRVSRTDGAMLGSGRDVAADVKALIGNVFVSGRDVEVIVKKNGDGGAIGTCQMSGDHKYGIYTDPEWWTDGKKFVFYNDVPYILVEGVNREPNGRLSPESWTNWFARISKLLAPTEDRRRKHEQRMKELDKQAEEAEKRDNEKRAKRTFKVKEFGVPENGNSTPR
jgi:hypothetical protein